MKRNLEQEEDPTPLTFVTGNAGKLREVKAMLEPEFTTISRDMDLVEIQGSSDEVARAKCREAAGIIDGTFFVEDTSLRIDALGGLPGPYIKTFLAKCGTAGILSMISQDGPGDDRRAQGVCKIGLVDRRTPAEERHVIFTGITEGWIPEKARGSHGFGWDEIFEVAMPDGSLKAFAEMKDSEKAYFSPRGKAVAQLKRYLQENEKEEGEC